MLLVKGGISKKTRQDNGGAALHVRSLVYNEGFHLDGNIPACFPCVSMG